MNDTPYVFESPDGGNTITKRKHGSTEKEYVISNNLGSTLVNSNITNSDITMRVNGKDRNVSELFDVVDAIEKRLAILRPDPELLEKYEVLQSMYEQYKAAEALLCDPTNTGVEEK